MKMNESVVTREEIIDFDRIAVDEQLAYKLFGAHCWWPSPEEIGPQPRRCSSIF
jgi:hypothetical protein